MRDWIDQLIRNNPEYQGKRIIRQSPDCVAFADGRKIHWCFAALPMKTVGADYACSTDDGYVLGSSGTYSTARTTSTSYVSNSNGVYVGQRLLTGTYSVLRSFLKFNTSGINIYATISQVNMKLVCTSDGSDTDFDVQIVKQNWSAQDPLSNTNREAAFDGCLAGTADNAIWRNTSGMSINTQYTSGNLDTTWINTTGYTYYSLRSSLDKAGTAPSGNELVFIASQEHATAVYRPILAITTTCGDPVISTISCPDGAPGTAYSTTLAATPTGGTWAITTGILPNGLELNPATGEISGMPTTVELQSFTVSYTIDCDAVYDTADLSIDIYNVKYTDITTPVDPSWSNSASSETATWADSTTPVDPSWSATDSKDTASWADAKTVSDPTWRDI